MFSIITSFKSLHDLSFLGNLSAWQENIFPEEELAIDAKVQIDAKKKIIESDEPMKILKETLEYDEKNPKPKDKPVKKL